MYGTSRPPRGTSRLAPRAGGRPSPGRAKGAARGRRRPKTRRQKPFLFGGGSTVPPLTGGTGGAPVVGTPVVGTPVVDTPVVGRPVVGTDAGTGSVAASRSIPPGCSGHTVVGCVPLT